MVCKLTSLICSWIKTLLKTKTKNLFFGTILQEKLSKCTAWLVDCISLPFPQHCILMYIIISVTMNPHEESTMHSMLYENKIGYISPEIFGTTKHKMPLSKSSIYAFYWQFKETWSVLHNKDAGQPLVFNISNTKSKSFVVTTQLVNCCRMYVADTEFDIAPIVNRIFCIFMLPRFNCSMWLRRVIWKHTVNFPRATHKKLDKDKNFQKKSLLWRSCIPGFRQGIQTSLYAPSNQNTFLLPCSTQKQPKL